MTATLRIRRAVSADVEDLARLRALMDIEDGVAEPADFRARFVRWYQQHGHRFSVFVAESAGSLVGTVWLERVERVPRPCEIAPAKLGYVTFMFVEKAQRNQGIGTAMLQELRAEAIAEGYSNLIVWPSARSTPLYIRAGFTTPRELLEQELPS